MSASIAGGVVLAGHGQPAEHPPGVAGLRAAPAPRRGWRRRATRRRPSRAARADSEHAVAVAVGLDHRHHRRAPARTSSRSGRTLCRIAPGRRRSRRARSGWLMAHRFFHQAAAGGSRTAAGMRVRHGRRRPAARPGRRGSRRRRAARTRPRPRRTARARRRAGRRSARQHVARTGGGQPRRAGRGDPDPAVRGGDQRVPALEQHHGAVTFRGEPRVLERRWPRPPRARRRASGPARRRAGSGPPGPPGAREVLRARRRRPRAGPRRRAPAARASSASSPPPEPTTQACTRPAPTTSGWAARTRSRRPRRRRTAPCRPARWPRPRR